MRAFFFCSLADHLTFFFALLYLYNILLYALFSFNSTSNNSAMFREIFIYFSFFFHFFMYFVFFNRRFNPYYCDATLIAYTWFSTIDKIACLWQFGTLFGSKSFLCFTFNCRFLLLHSVFFFACFSFTFTLAKISKIVEERKK